MDDLYNTSNFAKRFVRVNYDDSRKFPWLIKWGENHEWGSYRCREAALKAANNLQVLCDIFFEYRNG